MPRAGGTIPHSNLHSPTTPRQGTRLSVNGVVCMVVFWVHHLDGDDEGCHVDPWEDRKGTVSQLDPQGQVVHSGPHVSVRR